jgi:hypothetical protein
MSDKKCKPPSCEYSIAREKCVKPNPYIQYKSMCSRMNIPFSSCINSYDKEKASKKACDYYKEYLIFNEEKLKKKKSPKVKPIKEPKVKPIKEPKVKPIKEPKVKPIKEPKVKPIKEPKVKPEVKPEVKPDIKPDVKPNVKPDIKPDVKPDIKPNVKPNIYNKKGKIVKPRRPMHILTPIFDISDISARSETPSFNSFSSSPSIKNFKKIKRSSSSTFNLSNKSSSFKTPPTSLKQSSSSSSFRTPPASFKQSSPSLKTPSDSMLNKISTLSTSSSSSKLSSSTSNYKTVSDKSLKSSSNIYKTIRTEPPSNIENDIEKIQEENKKLENELRTLINKNKYLNTSSENRKIQGKKIAKFILPIIHRVGNINNRIKYYNILHKYIETRHKYSKNCLRLYKYDDDDNPIYRIGNRIILEKQIGSSSKYGTVFLSYYKLNNRKFGKIFKFATKISDSLYHRNITEYKVLNDLTKLSLNNACHHFPICYGKFNCNSQNIQKSNSLYESDKNNSFVNQGSRSFQSFINKLPENINGKNNIIITLNELAEGDAYNFVKINHKNDKILLNSLIQMLLSIMFFHNYINAFHFDSHSGNFLYHKIKSGGYFHYNIQGKDYYLENIGFLWVIWDFGLISPFNNSYVINNDKYGQSSYADIHINYDFLRIIKSGFMNKKIDGGVNDKYIFSDSVNFFVEKLFKLLNNSTYFNNSNINDLASLNKDMLNLMIFKIFDNTFKSSINDDDVIINVNKPFVI